MTFKFLPAILPAVLVAAMMLPAVMTTAAMGPGQSGGPVPDAQPPRAEDVDAAAQPPAATAAPAAPGLHVLPAAEADPAEFMWQARPLVVFADSGADPAFTEQMRAIERDAAALLARDVVVVTDTDPAAASQWRQMLRPEGFSLVLMDKDGQVKQRKPSPWTVREITRAIDKFPLRRQEIGRAGVGIAPMIRGDDR